MLRAILLDLDDTLLANAMERFVPAYLETLCEHLADEVPAPELVRELLQATAVMDAGDGSGPLNLEAFSAAFYPALGRDRMELEPLLERFYREAFPTLRALTRTVPCARALVGWARARGLQLVIATNPLFPRTAIEQRLEWAGLPPDEVGFDLVTTAENMRSTKSHPSYYEAILRHLGRSGGECLMAGDSWEQDVLRADAVSIPAFWIAPQGVEPPDAAPPLLGHGPLDELWRLAASGELERRHAEWPAARAGSGAATSPRRRR